MLKAITFAIALNLIVKQKRGYVVDYRFCQQLTGQQKCQYERIDTDNERADHVKSLEWSSGTAVDSLGSCGATRSK